MPLTRARRASAGGVEATVELRSGSNSKHISLADPAAAALPKRTLIASDSCSSDGSADRIPVGAAAAAAGDCLSSDASQPSSPGSDGSACRAAADAAAADAAAAADGALLPLLPQLSSSSVTGQAAAGGDSSSGGGAMFEQLCNGGWGWTWSNCLVKLNRYFLVFLKQIFILWGSLSLPTNHLMLTFRTMTRDFGEPHANGDFLAAKFRDELMPRRGRMHRQRSPLVRVSRFFIEFPVFGIPGIVRFIDVRTQWFDDCVKAAMRDGIKQVVIIAAGYDTRAYRLGQPGVKFFEIDLPHASQHKQELVRKLLPASEYSRPEFVAADLSKVKLDDALATTSFDPSQPTLFTVEGLVYYLPVPAVQQLLTSISSSSAKGSRLILDFLHLSAVSGSKWHPGYESLFLSVANKGEVMYNGIDERPEAVAALLAMFGYEARSVLTARDLVRTYMPHRSYRGAPPVVSPYFGYFSAEKL